LSTELFSPVRGESSGKKKEIDARTQVSQQSERLFSEFKQLVLTSVLTFSLSMRRLGVLLPSNLGARTSGKNIFLFARRTQLLLPAPNSQFAFKLEHQHSRDVFACAKQ
jgi:hypothetical protein